MTYYDILLQAMAQYLPTNFDLRYNNTLDTKWDEILPEEYGELVYGVLRVDSSANEYVGTQTIKKENMRLSVAIPNTKDTFNQAIADIEHFIAVFNEAKVPVETREEQVAGQDPIQIVTYAKVEIQGRTDGAIERLNGIDWIVTDIRISTSIYESLITSDDVVITIDSNNLDVGIISVNYDYTASQESKILGETQVPTQFGTGNQKQLILTVVPQNKPVYKSLLENEDNANKEYSISYFNGIVTRTFTAHLIGVNENVMAGNTYVATIKFIRTK